MSTRRDDRPRYKPAQPTSEQLRVINELVNRLSGASDKPDADVPPPHAADEAA